MELTSRHLVAMPRGVPLPSHRHATPSGPWPWMDLDSEETHLPLTAPPCGHENCEICPLWLRYPQSHFPNWTPDQVERCKIAPAIRNRQHNCKIYHVDVKDEHGLFVQQDDSSQAEFLLTRDNHRELWDWLKVSSRPEGLRARALFIENISGPALQILGASYNIEPFFFSSSLNWIPSRYQEDVRHGMGDHITITLTYLRTMPSSEVVVPSLSQHSLASTIRDMGLVRANTSYANEYLYALNEKDSYQTEIIDTQAPLALRSGKNDHHTLLLDILDLHMIRHRDTSTLISYHADPEWRMTAAKDLHGRARLVGESVYWKDIFARSVDPTFLLLAILWHALYAWDEALEVLYSHICWLEGKVIGTNDTQITRELHMIRAHLLHYESLLDDFHKSVKFVLDTRNPAMESVDQEQRTKDRRLLEKETRNLSIEIERLQMSRRMQDLRLKNVMNLVFSSVNLEDSKRMQEMTEAAVRDSEAMKQIAYLTMVFLPASFVAGIFGMNVKEINPGTNGTVPHYIATVVSLTLISIWVIVAFQSKHYLQGQSMWRRLLWPVEFLKQLFLKEMKRNPKPPPLQLSNIPTEVL